MNRCCCCIRSYLECGDSSPLFPFGLCNAKAVTSHRTPKSLHRIVAAGMKRMTAQEPPQAHRAPAQRAVPFNRFARVFGTRGHKATRGRQPRRDRGFVKFQKRNKNNSHRSLKNLTATLGLAYLSNNSTKLAEPKFFI